VRKNGIPVGTTSVSQASVRKLWVTAGNFTFTETDLPAGYTGATPGFSFTGGQATTSFTFANIIRFDLAVDKIAPATVRKGKPVTYTYKVTNAGPASVKPKLRDDVCGSISFTGGDVDHDGRVDPGEVWTYRCSCTAPTKVGAKIIGTATVSDAQAPSGSFTGGDSVPANNSDTTTVKVVA